MVTDDGPATLDSHRPRAGTYTRSARLAMSPSQDGVVPDLSAPLAKRRRAA